MIKLFNDRYGIDSEGNVYSLRNNSGNPRSVPKKMKTQLDRAGYKALSLNLGETRRYVNVHRLVAETFIPNPENKPQVNHIDGDKLNNCVGNLEWVTASENMIHALETGLKIPKGPQGYFNELHARSKPVNMLSMSGEFLKRFPSMQEAKRQGFSQGNISSVIAGNRKSHKGFKWEYAA